MIVRMKEILLFTSARSVDATIQKLGELGVMDIKEISKPSSDVLERCLNDIDDAKQAISVLEQHNLADEFSSVGNPENDKDPKRIVGRLLKSKIVRQNIHKALEELQIQYDFYETWGNKFTKKDLQFLQQKGIYIRLYRIDKTLAKTLPKDIITIRFPERDGKIPVALFSQDGSDKLGFKEEIIPDLSYATVETKKTTAGPSGCVFR